MAERKVEYSPLQNIKESIEMAFMKLPKEIKKGIGLYKFMGKSPFKEALGRCNNSLELLKFLITVEQRMFPYINKELKILTYSDKSKEIGSTKEETLSIEKKEQKKIVETKEQIELIKKESPALGQCLVFLSEMNRTLMQAVPELIVLTGLPDVKGIEKRIKLKLDTLRLDISPSDRKEKFLNEMRKALLLSLIKASLFPSAKKFIVSLNKILEKNGHSLRLEGNFSAELQSFKAYPVETGAKAIFNSDVNINVNPNVNPNVNVNNLESPHAEGSSLSERMTNVTKNKGSKSSIAFEVDLITEENVEQISRGESSFFYDNGNIERAVRHNISGTIMFDTGGQASYSPFHIDMLHELIHVAHNSQGENRENVPLTEEEEKLWQTAEEYWAIQGDPQFNQNQFSKEFGVQPVLGHRGLSAFEFTKSSYEVKLQLKEEKLTL